MSSVLVGSGIDDPERSNFRGAGTCGHEETRSASSSESSILRRFPRRAPVKNINLEENELCTYVRAQLRALKEKIKKNETFTENHKEKRINLTAAFRG